MHLGALCMQLRAPVSFYSLWEGQKWGFFHLIDKIADFLHNKRFFSDSPEGFALLLGQCAALRSLAQSTTPFLASGKAKNGVFFPKDRTYRAFLHNKRFFLIAPRDLHYY